MLGILLGEISALGRECGVNVMDERASVVVSRRSVTSQRGVGEERGGGGGIEIYERFFNLLSLVAFHL